MDHEIQTLLISQIGTPCIVNVVANLPNAYDPLGKLVVHALISTETLSGQHLVTMNSSKEVMEMCRIARERKRSSIDCYAKVVLNNLSNVLEHVFILTRPRQLLLGRSRCACVNQAHCYTTRFIIAKCHAELTTYPTNQLTAQPKFVWIALLNVIGEWHPNLDTLLRASNGKRYVVRKSEREIGAQLIWKLSTNPIDRRCRKSKNLLGNILDSLKLTFIYAVIGMSHLRKLNLMRHLTVANPLSHGDALLPCAIYAHGNIVVDAANGLHTGLPSIPSRAYERTHSYVRSK